MFTTPKIFTSKSSNGRSYVIYNFDGKRVRHYNGNCLNLNINPNQFTNTKDRDRLIQQLQFEVHSALKNGWNPFEIEAEKPSLKQALLTILTEKLESNLCDLYKRNLKAVYRMFVDFLPSSDLNNKCDSLKLDKVETFLNKFQTSERNYINRRRCLGMFFNEMVRKGFATHNVVKNTKPAKAKASLHIPYSDKQLRDVLDYLKANQPNLHLCCLLTYGCLLRPHHEIRLLKLRHIVKDFTQIQLSGSENKSKRIRTVHIPAYIQDVLRARLINVVNPDTNIFTLTSEPYSVGYFNLMWGKEKIKMFRANILEANQTIYSFRHTAVINVYQKTKDLHIVQQLLQHSNMIVTLNYLRGLGEMNDDKLKDVLPSL